MLSNCDVRRNFTFNRGVSFSDSDHRGLFVGDNRGGCSLDSRQAWHMRKGALGVA